MKIACLAVLVTSLAACGTDPDPDPNLIASHDDAVYEVAADDDGVYWTVRGDEETWVMVRAAGASSPTSVADAHFEFAFVELVLAGDELVYDLEDDFRLSSEVMAMPKLGGSPRVHYQTPTDWDGRVMGVSGHDGVASWAAVYSEQETVIVLRADLATDELTTIVDGLAEQAVLTASDATHTYWTQDDLIYRSDGTTPELFTDTREVGALAIDDTHVYWIDDQALFRVIKDAPESGRYILDEDVGPTSHLVVHDERVYWLETEGVPTIYAKSSDGLGDRVVVVEGDGLQDFAVTDAGLYYSSTTYDNGSADGQVVLVPAEEL